MNRFDLFSPILRRGDGHGDQSNTDQRRFHVFRRITGYHNALDNHEDQYPPDYDARASIPSPLRTYDVLPPYSCSVGQEGVVQMKMERPDPFHRYNHAVWEPVHLKLHGTLLQISAAKVHGLFTHSSKRGTYTGEPGRLIRTYTLQHAEIGLASDFKKYELLPKSPMAQLLPDSALKQLQETDPDQFIMVYNHIARVRVEEVQLVLRFGSAEERAGWMDALCAAIDIAPPLEARSEPRNHTLPRRRRRDRHASTQGQEGASQSTPGPGGESSSNAQSAENNPPPGSRQAGPASLQRTNTAGTNDGNDNDNDDGDGEGEGEGEDAGNNQQAEQGPDPDREDLDLAFMAAGQVSRNTRGSTGSDSPQGMFSPDDWANAPSKSAPPPALDPVREARYRRRCMPMLVSNSRYANDIIIHKGKRVWIDWESQTLQSYPANPPAYTRSMSESALPQTEGSPSTTSNLKKLIRQASVAEVRTLARFRSKDAIPENSSTEGTDISRSSEEQSTSSGLLPKGGGSLSRRLKAFARVTDDSTKEQTLEIPAGQRAQDGLVSDTGLIPVSPGRMAPEAVPEPPPKTIRNKASKILGQDAPATSPPTHEAASHPSISRSASVMSDPAGSSMNTDSPLHQRRIPTKAHKLLGSISGWPSSPVSPIQRSNSLTSDLEASPRTPAITLERIPPKISELPTSEVDLAPGSQPQGAPSELPQSPTTPTSAVSPIESKNNRLRPTPLQPTVPMAVELSALPPTPRSVSTPALGVTTQPQKRLTAETGLIPVEPSSPPGAAPSATPAVSKSSARIRRSLSAASELPGSPPSRALSPAFSEASAPSPARGANSRLQRLRREMLGDASGGSAGRSASASASGRVTDANAGRDAERSDKPRGQLKKTQSTDAIPTRPRHHDKAFRTLGIVS